MRVLHVLIARGGSKGIPGKNLRTVAGRSLVAWKALGARRSRHCDRLVVSSDSDAIRAEAEAHGAEAPFVRPPELSGDEVSSEAVLLHAMEWVEREEGARYDAVMLLEPTCPFTRPADYDRAVEMMRERDAVAVIGMRETEVSSVFVGPMDAEGRIAPIVERVASLPSLRRQDQAPEYTMNGALWLLRWDWFAASRRRYADPLRTYGHVMPAEYSVDINTPLDLEWAELLVRRGHVDPALWE